MRTEQKTVALGAVTGAVLMVASVCILTMLLPAPLLADAVAERLAYALRANAFAMLPLVMMFIVIAKQRFFSDAIDPTRHVESRALEINRRVASNTLEQNFVFVVASLAMSTVVPTNRVQVVWAAAIVFVIARVAFWVGYRINPPYRAAGMSATALVSLGMILYVGFHVIAGE